MSRTTTWTLAELLSFRTSVICSSASAVTVITYSPWQLRMSHSAVTSISSPGGTRGVDDPQFPVDVGAPYPEPRGGLVGKGASPWLWTMAVNYPVGSAAGWPGTR